MSQSFSALDREQVCFPNLYDFNSVRSSLIHPNVLSNTSVFSIIVTSSFAVLMDDTGNLLSVNVSHSFNLSSASPSLVPTLTANSMILESNNTLQRVYQQNVGGGFIETKLVNDTLSATGYDRDEALAQIEIATLAVIFVVTLFGNGTVLLALFARNRYSGRKKLSRMYFFILHLSIADLVTAFFNVLPQLIWEVTYRFRGGAILCKAVKFAQPVGPYLSSYVLTATAIDRHQAICHPLTYCSWTSRRSKGMVCLAWLCSLIFCVPQIIIFSYQIVPDAPGVYDCWATFSESWGEKAYVTWYSISVFIIPLCVLVLTYSCICREIWRNAGRCSGLRAVISPPASPPPNQRSTQRAQNKQIANQNRQLCFRFRSEAPLISRAKINTVKQTIAVIAMYVACSTPFISAQLWASWDPYAYASPFWTGATFTILTLLSSLNSCVNPWIYLCFNKDLLKLLHQLVCGNTHKNYTTGTNNSGSNSSQGMESTSSRVPSKISFNTNVRNVKKNSTKFVGRPLVQYQSRQWIVSTPPIT